MPYADLTDVRLYYELAGNGEPVLLIPGLGATCQLWDPIVEELAEDFTLILPDNRGVGKSESKRQPHEIHDFSADLIELMDHLQIEQTHVVGISLGGIIAQCFACDHPDLVDRLVLISTTHRFGPYLSALTDLLGHALRKFSLEQFIRTIETLSTSPIYVDAHAEEMEREIQETVKRYSSRAGVGRQLMSLCSSEFSEWEYNITAPTLVVAGEYDALIPHCYARKMADEIMGSRFVYLPDCGHNPIFEQPTTVLPLMHRFLNGEAVGEAVHPEEEPVEVGAAAIPGSAASESMENETKVGGMEE